MYTESHKSPRTMLQAGQDAARGQVACQPLLPGGHWQSTANTSVTQFTARPMYRRDRVQHEDGRRANHFYLVDALGGEHLAAVGEERDTRDGHYLYRAMPPFDATHPESWGAPRGVCQNARCCACVGTYCRSRLRLTTRTAQPRRAGSRWPWEQKSRMSVRIAWRLRQAMLAAWWSGCTR